jgi:hypothetical protein
MKAFWFTLAGNIYSSLFTSWFMGVERGYNRENQIYMYIENNLFLQNQQANFNQTSYKSSLDEDDKEMSK